MQNVWMFVENRSVFVYVIAGLTVFGVLTKLLLQGKLHRLLKASENMAMTKERQMRTIRNHYENNLNLDLPVNHIQSFVEKYIFKLKFLGIPVRIWDSAALEMAMLAVATGAIGIVDAVHLGLGGTGISEILIATVVSCALLLSIENLYRIESFYARLEVNIEDYLDNNLRNRIGRPIIKRAERAAQRTAASNDELVAVASEITSQGRKQEGRVDRTKTGFYGRGDSRPVSMDEVTDRSGEEEFCEDIPEYEIRRKATRNFRKGSEEGEYVRKGNGQAQKDFEYASQEGRHMGQGSGDASQEGGCTRQGFEYVSQEGGRMQQRQKGVRKDDQQDMGRIHAGQEMSIAEREAAAEQEISDGLEEERMKSGGSDYGEYDAKVVAEVLKNFFSG